jgi:8-oxo-dGTP pyrophosphatase MutT (NUDIX family)
MHSHAAHYLDFNKRITAIRETFEEVNILLADNIPNQKTHLRD